MDKVVETVMKKITDGKYDTNIFDCLIRLKDEIKKSADEISSEYGRSSIKEFCLFIKKDYTRAELRKLRKLILEKILSELQNKDISYLQAARLVEAFDCLDDADNLPKSNKRVKFLVTYNIISQNYYTDIARALKTISLLDDV